jgi:HK97 family phage major capsid protein
MDPIDKLPMLRRTMLAEFKELERAVGESDTDPKKYEMAFSSEYPVKRWWGGTEILDHNPSSVRMDRMRNGASVLLNHREHIGIVVRASVGDDRVGRAVVAFSPNNPVAAMVERDVAHPMKFRRHVSVGYAIHRMVLEEQNDDAGDTYRAMDWEPMEVSIVDVPADPSVGMGRDSTGQMYPVTVEDGRTVKEERSMGEKTAVEETAKPAPAATAVIDVQADQRKVELIALAAANRANDLLGGWLEKGTSVGEACKELVERQTTKGQTVTTLPENPVAGMARKDRQRYSYLRALRQSLAEREDRGKLDGIEGEIHEEIRKQMPHDYKYRGGVLLPLSLATPEEIAARAFPLDSITATEGAELKFVEPRELIELLRTRLAVVRLGARLLTGLVGPLTFPRQTAAGVASWIAEEASVTDSMAAFDTVAMTPKTLMSSSGYTRQLLEQSNYDVEAIVRADLAAIHARAIDFVAIQGTGASNQPRGVANQVGVLVRDCGAGAGADAVPDLTDLVSMIGLVADANADYGALGFLTTPLLAATLSRSLVASAAGSDMLWTGRLDEGLIQGYRAVATNQVSKVWNNGATTGGAEHGLLYGNWNELLIALWNAMEAIVDPYSQKKAARIEVTTFQMADTAVRHPVSFCIGTNAIP